MNSRTTSLGVSYRIKPDSTISLVLSEVRMFTGLSVIARLLGDEILEQVYGGESDILVRRRIIKDITPELASIGLANIQVYARHHVLEKMPLDRQKFLYQIRAVFGTLQRPSWGSVLFPELFDTDTKPPGAQALLFPFHLHPESEEIDYFFLVERDTNRKFLRITIESEYESRLNLDAIVHTTVDDLDRRTYIQGLTRMAETFCLGMQRDFENHRTEHVETARRHPDFFKQLQQAGLKNCESIGFHWRSDRIDRYLNKSHRESVTFVKMLLLVLEDREITSLLSEGRTVEVEIGDKRGFLDVSRLGRNLNLSFERKRSEVDLAHYLHRMPQLEKTAQSRQNIFTKTDIFLVHHITSEILGTIKALEIMGAPRITVLFVKYAGIVPPDYLETLLSLPSEKFSFYGLQKIENEARPGGFFSLSSQYSDIAGLKDLDMAMTELSDFFMAMRTAAGHLFFKAALAAQADGRRILLVEDGGYLAPHLQRCSIEKQTLQTTLESFNLDHKILGKATKQSLQNWLSQSMPGTIEHTRNGYDRIRQVLDESGSLAFPTMSIAISKIKRDGESIEVSASLLHAIESILHGAGLVLGERNAIVLGSRGAIGRNVMKDLVARTRALVLGVDIMVTNDDATSLPGSREVSDVSRLPRDEWLLCDLILGVVGTSILDQDILIDLVLNAKKPALFFASGSTKTVEFAQLSEWLQKLCAMEQPMLGDLPVRILSKPIRDPQTALIQGTWVRISRSDGPLRELYLLGDLTPINFLYYGVPTESMDAILAQLLQLSAGLVNLADQGRLPEPGLYAIDHEVNAEGEPID